MSIYEKTVNYLISQNIISPNKKDIYMYGFELLFADILNFSVIFTIGIILCGFSPTSIYCVVFIFLRSFCGGYHSNTHLRCHICTIGVFIIFIVLFKVLTNNNNFVIFIIDLIAYIPILVFSPIEHKNKPLSEINRKHNRLVSIIAVPFLIFIAVFLQFLRLKEGLAISLTLWIVSLCMIPTINIYNFKNRRI